MADICAQSLEGNNTHGTRGDFASGSEACVWSHFLLKAPPQLCDSFMTKEAPKGWDPRSETSRWAHVCIRAFTVRGTWAECEAGTPWAGEVNRGPGLWRRPGLDRPRSWWMAGGQREGSPFHPVSPGSACELSCTARGEILGNGAKNSRQKDKKLREAPADSCYGGEKDSGSESPRRWGPGKQPKLSEETPTLPQPQITSVPTWSKCLVWHL